MKHLHCTLFGHNFQVSKEVTYHVKEYKCKNCGLEMTINAEGVMVPLTLKQRRINSVLHQVHNKRLEKSQRWLMIED
jgi:transposase-like protein